MFKIDPNPTFWADVRLTVPGEIEPVPVRFEFRHKDKAELLAFHERAADQPDDVTLAEVVANWSGFNESYSEPALRRLLLKYGPASKEIYRAYFSALTQSRVKN